MTNVTGEPEKMVVTFGKKYKDKMLEEIPSKDLEWLMGQAFFSRDQYKDYAMAVPQVLEKRKNGQLPEPPEITETTPKESKTPAEPPMTISSVKESKSPARIDINAPHSIDLGNRRRMELCKQEIELTEADGHIYKEHGKFALTYEAFLHINQFAQISLLTPPTVVVNGQEQHNPYIIRNPKSRAVEIVCVRKIAFARAPMGNLVAIDQTLSFAPHTYLVESLLKLVREHPDVAEIRTLTSLTDDEQRRLKYYEIDDNLVVLIKDMVNDEYMTVLKNHNMKQKFGERIAVSICERNCLAKHPCIGTKKTKMIGYGEGAKAMIPAFTFVETPESRSEITRITREINEGHEIKNVGIEVQDFVQDADEAEKEMDQEATIEEKSTPGAERED